MTTGTDHQEFTNPLSVMHHVDRQGRLGSTTYGHIVCFCKKERNKLIVHFRLTLRTTVY